MTQADSVANLFWKDRWVERREACRPIFRALDGWHNLSGPSDLRNAVDCAEQALELVPDAFRRHAERMIELPRRRLADMELGS